MQIAPSLLSADFAHLEQQIRLVEEGGADLLHLDVMDGHFVPNLTFGPMIVKAIRRLSRIPLDVHLMIEDPLRYLQPFVDAGSDWITVHAECCSLLGEAIEAVRTAGVKAGVSLNPLTPFSGLERELLSADLVLMMTVHPGFGGQRFMDSVLPKIAQFRKLRDDKHQTTPVIAVDGGIDEKTAPMAVRAGAEILVAGSAIFNAPDPARAIGALRAAGEGV